MDRDAAVALLCNDLFSLSDDDDERHAIDEYADLARWVNISRVDVASCIL